MANLSTATGTLTLKGSASSIKSFIQLLTTVAKHWTYPTTLLVNDVAALKQTIQDNQITVKFEGIGEWSYKNNIKCLVPSFIDTFLDNALDQAQTRQLNQFLKDPLILSFDYADLTDDLLYTCVTELTWNKTSLSDVNDQYYSTILNHLPIINVTSEMEIDYTVTNIQTYFKVDTYENTALSLEALINEHGFPEIAEILELDTDLEPLNENWTTIYPLFDELNQTLPKTVYLNLEDWLDDESNAKTLEMALNQAQSNALKQE